MDIKAINEVANAKLNPSEFSRLSSFVFNEFGIKMPPGKKILLQSRLHKRLRALKFTTFDEYCNYLFSAEGIKQNEVIHMIDVVSTNKTDFFREPVHFDFMKANILPQFAGNNKTNVKLKIWSAGCSSGEEPYTIAMAISEFIEKNQNINYSILCTDISTRVLDLAGGAVYKEERTADIPLSLKQKYFLRSKDREKKMVKVIPELREKLTFQRLNFMDVSYDVPNDFDIVFCRNVLIYFDQETQRKVVSKLCSKLKSGGYLFLGHSESAMRMDIPIGQIKPAIYVKE